MIRTLDILFSFLGLIILTPVFIIISLLILFTSKGSIFYKQKRVGKNNKDFILFKFRTMYKDADKSGLLTIGEIDDRITKVGGFLRKNKIDELPQLLNVLTGNMSMVGPRPEVRKYVDLYNDEQKRVLTVRPGITDYASVKFRDENQILAQFGNPEKKYIEDIMPHKIQINLSYMDSISLKEYFRVLLLTGKTVIFARR